MIAYERYPIGGRSPEWMLTLGTSDGPQVLFIPPLFEEHNFTRSFVVTIGRGLSQRCGVWLPDLPGCGESLRELADVRLADWQAAIAAAAAFVAERCGRAPHVASFRAGALLDGSTFASQVWRFAPATGAEQLRAMRRAQAISDREAGTRSDTLIGYALSSDMIADLEQAAPQEAIAAHVVGWPEGSTPLWRRAEPSGDAAVADRLAADLLAWIERCDA